MPIFEAKYMDWLEREELFILRNREVESWQGELEEQLYSGKTPAQMDAIYLEHQAQRQMADAGIVALRFWRPDLERWMTQPYYYSPDPSVRATGFISKTEVEAMTGVAWWD